MSPTVRAANIAANNAARNGTSFRSELGKVQDARTADVKSFHYERKLAEKAAARKAAPNIPDVVGMAAPPSKAAIQQHVNLASTTSRTSGGGAHPGNGKGRGNPNHGKDGRFD